MSAHVDLKACEHRWDSAFMTLASWPPQTPLDRCFPPFLNHHDTRRAAKTSMRFSLCPSLLSACAKVWRRVIWFLTLRLGVEIIILMFPHRSRWRLRLKYSHMDPIKTGTWRIKSNKTRKTGAVCWEYQANWKTGMMWKYARCALMKQPTADARICPNMKLSSAARWTKCAKPCCSRGEPALLQTADGQWREHGVHLFLTGLSPTLCF